jgi:epoxyqueuosine reductase
MMREAIRDRALLEGFDAVGFARPEAGAEAGARLKEFLALGRHGDMGWMAENAERRADPRVLWPAARSLILLGTNYGPASDPLALLDHPRRGAISCYAQNRDYHDLIKARLKRLARWIAAEFAAEVKVFVDTAPVLEKPLAQAAGLGWQGKHTNLVARGFGSWLFLGSVFTTLDLAPDAPERDHCGACRRCLDICPTNAFPAPYQLDARRCISYLTIEHKDHIPRDLRPAIGNRIYGCDDCLAVCPWNKFAHAHAEPGFLPRVELKAPMLADLAGLDEAGFRAVFAGSPIKRIGRDRFLRNVLIAIGNSDAPDLAPVVARRLDDASPLVRAAAVWALSRLCAAAAFTALRAAHLPAESDEEVRAEWLAVPVPAEA